MSRKIFDTPIVTPVITKLFALTMKVAGWTVVGERPPNMSKFVAVVAPHTSNWDAVIVLMTSFALGLDAHWMAKQSLFRFPLGAIMRYLGAVPVDRLKNSDVTSDIAKLFSESKNIVLGIAPEGTRGKAERWRTGFWHIAQKADVPIVLAFIDYKNKRCGLLGEFVSSGNLESDMEEIRSRYRACLDSSDI